MYEEAAAFMREQFKKTRLYQSNPTNGLIGFTTQDFTHFIPGKFQAMQSDFSKVTYCPTARISRKIFLDELMEGCKTKTERLLVREKYREATRKIWSPPLKMSMQEIPAPLVAQKVPRTNYPSFAEMEKNAGVDLIEDEQARRMERDRISRVSLGLEAPMMKDLVTEHECGECLRDGSGRCGLEFEEDEDGFKEHKKMMESYADATKAIQDEEKQALAAYDLRQHDESIYRSMVAAEFD